MLQHSESRASYDGVDLKPEKQAHKSHRRLLPRSANCSNS